MRTEGLKDKLCPEILVLNLKVKTIEKQHQKRKKERKKILLSYSLPLVEEDRKQKINKLTYVIVSGAVR